MKQMDLFRENTLVAKTTEALVRALDARTGTPLKDILSQYNDRAVEASAGQADMFSDNSREGILRDVLGIKEDLATQTQQTEKNTVGAEEERKKSFATVFTQFKGKAREAINYILGRKTGRAVAALHHKDVGDIDLWYGDDKAGLKKIAQKHPEVLDDLQGIIDGMEVILSSDNRIILENDTHRAVISKMLGDEKTDNWLLSAYEKKEASGGSSDIVPEPERGKQNGTAPLQNPPSEGKGTDNSGNAQEKGEKNVVTEKRDHYNSGDRVILDEDGKEYTIEFIITEGEFIPGRPNTYTTYYRLDGKPYGKYTADQLSGIKQKSENREGQEPKRIVSDARMDELKARLRKKMFGQLNMGVDPELLAIGSELAVGYIERGLTKFADYAKQMISDIGDAIRPYLKSFYNAVRDMPEAEGYAAQMDSYEDVRNFDVTTLGENDSEAEGEITAEEREAREKFSKVVTAEMVVASQTGEKPYKSIVDLRKRARETGMKVDDSGRDDILLQELVEDGLMRAANQIIATRLTLAAVRGENVEEVRRSKELFDRIVRLYEMQPTIAARSTGRIQKQQYSTPLPMAYVAGMFAYDESMEKGLEPTAGNGMLTIAVPAHKVHVNEIDEKRLANLRGQGFAEVTDRDATQPFEGGRQYDFVLANPPFGSAEEKSYDGKVISGLDPQIALNALSAMKDDGKAVIIIGGNMEYRKNGGVLGKKQFFTYLYDHYNVKGVIDMDGKLFQKQGTTYPTRMIVIDGRRSDAEREQTQVYPPRQSEALPKVETFDDLYKTVSELINSNNKTNGHEVLRAAGSAPVSDGGNASGQTDLFGHRGESDANDGDGRNGGTGASVRGRRDGGNRQDEQGPVSGAQAESVPRIPRLGVPEVPRGAENLGGASVGARNRNNAEDVGRTGDSGGSPKVGVGRAGGTQLDGVGKPLAVGQSGQGIGQKERGEQRKLDQEKLPYRPHNNAFSLESVAPAAMVESMDASLSDIEKEVGSIDEFVRLELGYDTVEEAHNALAAEQMDSVAMAIYQMKKGQALVIGDQTGVGKGRQMAALIRWAVKHGKKPVFITKDANLFSDIYRDLVDIGIGVKYGLRGTAVHQYVRSAEDVMDLEAVLPEEDAKSCGSTIWTVRPADTTAPP